MVFTPSSLINEKGSVVAVRAIRGASALQADDPQEMTEAVVELMTAMLARNDLDAEAVISVILTSTPDLRSQFPALGLREGSLKGFGEVPLLCAQEIPVEGSMPRVVRVMAHVETSRSRGQISHVYLRGTEVLRGDLAQ